MSKRMFGISYRKSRCEKSKSRDLSKSRQPSGRGGFSTRGASARGCGARFGGTGGATCSANAPAAGTAINSVVRRRAEVIDPWSCRRVVRWSVIARDARRRRTHPRHDVALLERLGNEVQFRSAVLGWQPGELREHELQILQ